MPGLLLQLGELVTPIETRDPGGLLSCRVFLSVSSCQGFFGPWQLASKGSFPGPVCKFLGGCAVPESVVSCGQGRWHRASPYSMWEDRTQCHWRRGCPGGSLVLGIQRPRLGCCPRCGERATGKVTNQPKRTWRGEAGSWMRADCVKFWGLSDGPGLVGVTISRPSPLAPLQMAQ